MLCLSCKSRSVITPHKFDRRWFYCTECLFHFREANTDKQITFGLNTGYSYYLTDERDSPLSSVLLLMKRKRMAKVLRLHSGNNTPSIVDLGSGPGFFIQAAMELGLEHLGIELSRIHVDNYKALGLLGALADVEDYVQKCGDDRFDICNMEDVATYLHNVPKVFANIFRMTKPNGIFAFSDKHYYWPGNNVKNNLVNTEQTVYLSPPAWIYQIKKAGFKVITWRLNRGKIDIWARKEANDIDIRVSKPDKVTKTIDPLILKLATISLFQFTGCKSVDDVQGTFSYPHLKIKSKI